MSNTDDIIQKRRYSWNILQWSKNYFKSMKSTNGDYSYETVILYKYLTLMASTTFPVLSSMDVIGPFR